MVTDKQFTIHVGEYTRVAAVSLWGIHLLVYARHWVASDISHVQTSTVATGVGGVMGNKGGVAVGMVYRDATSLAFVGCHLAARCVLASVFHGFNCLLWLLLLLLLPVLCLFVAAVFSWRCFPIGLQGFACASAGRRLPEHLSWTSSRCEGCSVLAPVPPCVLVW